MSQNVSDFLVNRLIEWGITRVFGYPGDGINGIMGAMHRAQEKIDFVQVRHEEMAAFMACAHSKFTGQVGVCMATSGPGAIHLLNGLYDAKLDNMPVLAIVGQQARAALGGHYQQEVDLANLFKDVCGYVQQASVGAQIRHLVDRAMRIAVTERAVTCIIIPNDLQEIDAKMNPPRKHGTVHSGIGTPVSYTMPVQEELQRAADLLNAGERVAMLVGAGALHATDEIIEVAEILGAGVAKALLGKAAVPDDLPFVTGSIGLLGTRPSYNMMDECDTLLMVGSNFPYSEFLPKEGQAKGIQIDLKARNLSTRYPMDVNLLGDSKLTLQALIPLLKKKENRDWRNKIEEDIKDWWEVLHARAMESAHPINPQRIFWELSPRLPENCIICADSGSTTSWFARDLKLRRGMMASLSGMLATMGPAVPYAIAAKFAYPDRVPIAIAGDGAMQMSGINGLITIKKYWKMWKDPRLVIIISKNHDLNMVTWEQRVLAGDPKFECSQDLPDVSFAEFAESLGLMGINVNTAEEIPDALDRAMSADRPVVLDIVTDGSVPPLPPHISFTQAKNFVASILKGDPDRADLLQQTFKDLLKSYVH